MGFAFIAPFCLFFGIFLLGPFLYSFWLSLRATDIYADWYNRIGSMTYVGLGNYVELLHDAEFWWSLLMTLYYAALTIPTSIALALTLAVCLSSPMTRFKGLFRTGFFLPQVLDLLVIGIIWMLLFNTPNGAIDRIVRALLGGLSAEWRTALVMIAAIVLAGGLAYLINQWARSRFLYEERFATELAPLIVWIALTVIIAAPAVFLSVGFDRLVVQRYFGTPDSPQILGLLDNPVTVMPVIALVVVLKGVGLGMILFLTTIQQIPQSVYEAAEVDGANARQRAFLITLPLVKPIVLFLSITGLMATLNAFTEVYAMTFDTGGPVTEFAGESVRAAKLTGYMLWVNFRDFFYGRAAALSFILMAVALVISLGNFALLREDRR